MKDVRYTCTKEVNAVIHTVTLNPALDIFIDVPDFKPGEVNQASGFRTVSGGKGINVARALKKLGAECLAYGVACGRVGDALLSGLQVLGISGHFARGEGETRTNVKLTDTVSGETTDVNQKGPPITPELCEEAYSKLAASVRPGDTVCLCGSLPPGVPDGLYAEWITRLKALGAKVALDASKNALLLGISAEPDLIKPNVAELSSICGKELKTNAEIQAECERLVDSGVGMIALSMGTKGAMFVSSEASVFVPGIRVFVRSTTGAGDAMLASLIFALERGDALPDAAAFSVAFSAAHVASVPGSEADEETVNRLLQLVRDKAARQEAE